MHIIGFLAIEEACIGQGQQEDATTPTRETQKEVVLSESRGWKHSMGGGAGLLFPEVRAAERFCICLRCLLR